MLRLENVPNTVPSQYSDNDLGGAPNAADASVQSAPKPGDAGRAFVVWPSREDERFVQVRISTEELAYLDGDSYVIKSSKITAALVKYRGLIEARANERLKAQPGAREVTLDIGSLA